MRSWVTMILKGGFCTADNIQQKSKHKYGRDNGIHSTPRSQTQIRCGSRPTVQVSCGLHQADLDLLVKIL